MPEPGDALVARDRLLARTFVELADTLAEDFDVVAFLGLLAGRVVELVGVSAAEVVLLAPDGRLDALAATADLAPLQVRSDSGPLVDCARTAQVVACADLRTDGHRWPEFAAAAQAAGFRSVQAIPMRRRQQTVGALGLLDARPGALAADRGRLARALADIATIGLLQLRAIELGDQVATQLQTALRNRVVVEQAKGVLAERGSLPVDEAFEVLRRHARSNNLRLADVAAAVVARTADFAAILG